MNSKTRHIRDVWLIKIAEQAAIYNLHIAECNEILFPLRMCMCVCVKIARVQKSWLSFDEHYKSNKFPVRFSLLWWAIILIWKIYFVIKTYNYRLIFFSKKKKKNDETIVDYVYNYQYRFYITFLTNMYFHIFYYRSYFWIIWYYCQNKLHR